MSSRYPKEPNAPASRAIRDWTNPADAKRYRVVLEEAPRHRVRRGDARPTLTFVDLDANPPRQVTTLVPEGFPLEKATTKALAKLLLEAE